MTVPTKIRHSTTPGAKPASLVSGELAINEFDRALYYLDPALAAPANLLDQAATLVTDSNFIVNGAMEVDQIRAGALLSAAPAGYVLDLTRLVNSGSQVVSAQQVADAPPGFTKSLKIATTTANASPGSTDSCAISFPIEGRVSGRVGFGAAGALNVAIGFFVKTFRPGTYGINVSNGAANRGYSTTFTVAVSATWQWVAVTIPGDVTGTWATDNTVGMYVTIWMMAGSGLLMTPNQWTAGGAQGVAGMTNGVQSVNDFMQVTGMCVFPGYVMPTAVRALAMQLRFPNALAVCARYWQKSYDYEVVTGTVTIAGSHGDTRSFPGSFNYATGMAVRFPVSMRAVPTVTTYSTATGNAGLVRDSINASDVASSLSQIGQKGFLAQGVNALSVAFTVFLFHWTADARL